VYPIELEKAIEDHPDFAECAVFGVDDPEFGQAVKAVVVPRAGAALDAESLRAFTAAAISYYKVPTQWEIRTDPLPRNASGKLTKEPLRTGVASNFVEE
jgi:acyl-CoA synthetase (AMP-forming)/AMP-acid ligase II